MSYTPPVGDAANFTWDGAAAYTAPDGDAANLAFLGDAVDATLLGVGLLGAPQSTAWSGHRVWLESPGLLGAPQAEAERLPCLVGAVTLAGDPDDWIVCAFDAATHAFAGVAAVTAGGYSLSDLTAGAAYMVSARPKSGGVWQAEHGDYVMGDYVLASDPVATPYYFQASAVTASPTGATEPTWPTVVDGTVVDGGVTWTNKGAMVRPLMQGPLVAL